MVEEPPKEWVTDAKHASFSLGGLLAIVIIILITSSIFVSLNINGHGMARQGASEHLIDNLSQATKSYELDQDAYPPGDGTGSADLALCLSVEGPKKLAYYVFLRNMLDPKTGSILNPVWPSSEDPLARLIFYRNNVGRPDTLSIPPVKFKDSFDMWAAGCKYAEGDGLVRTSWAVNNWE